VKRISIIIAVVCAFALAGCKVEKQGDDTYKVTAPTPEAKAAAEKAKDKAQQVTHDAAAAVAKSTESTDKTKTETTSSTTTSATATTETSSTSKTTTRHN
jgi:ABC-type uncharacterized transport system auxiliary subunit